MSKDVPVVIEGQLYEQVSKLAVQYRRSIKQQTNLLVEKGIEAQGTPIVKVEQV